jgi:predicted MFS family arabinose efflux permease
LLFGLGFAVGRLTGGRLVDRWPARAVLGPSIFLAAIALGLSIGSIASSSLTGLMKAANPCDYGLVSTAWNLSFDLGIAIGGVGVALLVGAAGFTGTFLVLGGLFAVALILGLIGLRRDVMTP